MANQLRDDVSSIPVPLTDLEEYASFWYDVAVKSSTETPSHHHVTERIINMYMKYTESDALTPRKKDLAREEDVRSLIQLLLENPDMLAVEFTENPLHIAARFGKLVCAREILFRNPGFARDLNQDGDSPLHLAAANGFVQIVREISQVDLRMCFLRDKDGRTALHRAAIKGKVEVVNELLRVCPESLDATTARGDTALHLAVAYGQIETFIVLVKWVKRINKKEIINRKDREGNTVLHIATSRKQLQALQVLLDRKMISTEVEVNALNARGLTALDILYVLPQNLGERIDMEIVDILRIAGGLRTRDMKSQPLHSPNHVVINWGPALSQKSPSFVSHKFHETKNDSPSDVWNALLVVAVMITSVTFASLLVVPVMTASVTHEAVNSGAWIEIYSNESYHNITFQPRKPNLDSNPIAWIVFYSNQSYQNSTFQPWKPNLDSKPIAFTLPMSIHLFAVFNSAGFFASIVMIVVPKSGFPFRPFLLMAAFSLLVSYMCLIEAMLPAKILFVLIIAIPFVTFAVTQYIFPGRGWGSSKLLKLKWRNLGEQMPS